MGTNFYARIIPSKQRKEEIKKLIDSNDFDAITKAVKETYGTFETCVENAQVQGEIHLGKCSGGWKFLWNPNMHVIRNGHHEMISPNEGHTIYIWVKDPNTAFYVYPLTKQGIKNFIDREDVEVFDEYGEKQDKEEFFDMAVNWVTWRDRKTGEIKEAWDSKTYHEEAKERIYTCDNELVRYLSEHGTEFISESRTDFYSDGLRFATTIEFS